MVDPDEVAQCGLSCPQIQIVSFSVLDIRDNLGIISHISPQKQIL